MESVASRGSIRRPGQTKPDNNCLTIYRGRSAPRPANFYAPAATAPTQASGISCAASHGHPMPPTGGRARRPDETQWGAAVHAAQLARATVARWPRAADRSRRPTRLLDRRRRRACAGASAQTIVRRKIALPRKATTRVVGPVMGEVMNPALSGSLVRWESLKGNAARCSPTPSAASETPKHRRGSAQRTPGPRWRGERRWRGAGAEAPDEQGLQRHEASPEARLLGSGEGRRSYTLGHRSRLVVGPGASGAA